MKEKKPLTAKQKAAQIRLKEIVRVARACGFNVEVSMSLSSMLQSFHNDPPPVGLLMDEARRLNKLGNEFMLSTPPNQIAAQKTLEMGWAFDLAGAWLRCKMAGQLNPEAKQP